MLEELSEPKACTDVGGRDVLRSFAQWSLASLSTFSNSSGPNSGGVQKMDSP
jgi:hypothetical protein